MNASMDQEISNKDIVGSLYNIENNLQEAKQRAQYWQNINRNRAKTYNKRVDNLQELRFGDGGTEEQRAVYNLNSVMQKHKKTEDFNKLRDEEIAYKNEQRHQRHVKIQQKVDDARKKQKRDANLTKRKAKANEEKHENQRSLIQEHMDKQILYRREASKLRQEEILEQRAEVEEQRKYQ